MTESEAVALAMAHVMQTGYYEIDRPHLAKVQSVEPEPNWGCSWLVDITYNSDRGWGALIGVTASGTCQTWAD